jgi:hypothetical protein
MVYRMLPPRQSPVKKLSKDQGNSLRTWRVATGKKKACVDEPTHAAQKTARFLRVNPQDARA